jgi:hypothetical protein
MAAVSAVLAFVAAGCAPEGRAFVDDLDGGEQAGGGGGEEVGDARVPGRMGGSGGSPADAMTPAAMDARPAMPDAAPPADTAKAMDAARDSAPPPADVARDTAPPPDAAPPVPPGLVVWWKLDEAAGTASAADSSGNGNAAALTGLAAASAWKADRGGRVLECDGTGGALAADSTSLDGIRNAITIAAWVSRPQLGGGYSVVLSRQVGTTNGEHYFLGLSNDTPGFIGTVGTVFAPAALPTNQWVHLAATYDGTTIRIYQDGTQIASGAGTGTFAADTSKLTLCGNQNDAAGTIQERFTGRVDDVRVYDRALSAADIAALAQ